MAQNYRSSGTIISFVLVAAAVAGDIVRVSDTLIGVALGSGAIGESVEVQIQGEFELPKVSGTAFTAGQVLYFDESEGHVTDITDTGTNKHIGYASIPAGASDPTAYVLLTRP